MVEVEDAAQRRAVADPLIGLAVEQAVAITLGHVGAEQGHIDPLHGGGFTLLDAGGKLEGILNAGFLELGRGIENVGPVLGLPGRRNTGLFEIGQVVPEHAHVGICGQGIDLALVGGHFKQARQVMLILIPVLGHRAERLKIAGCRQFGDHEAVDQVDVGGRAGAEVERYALVVALAGQLDGVDGFASLGLEGLDAGFDQGGESLNIHDRDFGFGGNSGGGNQRQRGYRGQKTSFEHRLLLSCLRRLWMDGLLRSTLFSALRGNHKQCNVAIVNSYQIHGCDIPLQSAGFPVLQRLPEARPMHCNVLYRCKSRAVWFRAGAV